MQLRMSAVDPDDCSAGCRGCDYCARMTPALIAMASTPCSIEELTPPEDLVAAALVLFRRRGGEGADAIAPVAKQHARDQAS
jgi:hypothetical protein